MGTKVYKYGLQAPTTNADAVRDQIWRAHRYYNKLIEIERGRRAAVKAAQSLHPDVARIEAELDPLVREIEEMRSTKTKVPKALRERAKELRADRKAARAALREDVVVQQRVDAARADSHAEALRARASNELYWGTYLLVERAVDDAASSSIAPPNFKRWSGRGQLGVQVQKTRPLYGSELSGDDTRLRIVPVADRKGRPGRRFAELWLRVGSEARKPVWAVFPMRMHRAIPDHACITWASVSLYREGTRERWSVSITVEEQGKLKSEGNRAIAIDVRWRSLGDLCAAYWCDTDGKQGEILVDPQVISGLAKADSLRSIRDRHRDVLQSSLGVWLRDHKNELPEWLSERAEYLSRWKSSDRFVRLRHAWSKERWAGDDEGYALIEAWWLREYHLHDWEAAQRRRSAGRRNDAYSVFAKRCADEYDHVVFEKFDKRTFASKKNRPVKEDEKQEKDRQIKNRVDHAKRVNQKTAATSKLIEALKRASSTHGALWWEMPCAWTTIECNGCGQRDDWDPDKTLDHTCSRCGVTWDQRANAARNLLSHWRERPSAELAGNQCSQVRRSRFTKSKKNLSKSSGQPVENTDL